MSDSFSLLICLNGKEVHCESSGEHVGIEGIIKNSLESEFKNTGVEKKGTSPLTVTL